MSASLIDFSLFVTDRLRAMVLTLVAIVVVKLVVG